MVRFFQNAGDSHGADDSTANQGCLSALETTAHQGCLSALENVSPSDETECRAKVGLSVELAVDLLDADMDDKRLSPATSHTPVQGSAAEVPADDDSGLDQACIFAVPSDDEFKRHLLDLFREKAEYLASRGRSTGPADVAVTWVDMIRLMDLVGMPDGHRRAFVAFMWSPRFQSDFRWEGDEVLYQIR